MTARRPQAAIPHLAHSSCTLRQRHAISQLLEVGTAEHKGASSDHPIGFHRASLKFTCAGCMRKATAGRHDVLLHVSTVLQDPYRPERYGTNFAIKGRVSVAVQGMLGAGIQALTFDVACSPQHRSSPGCPVAPHGLYITPTAHIRRSIPVDFGHPTDHPIRG